MAARQIGRGERPGGKIASRDPAPTSLAQLSPDLSGGSHIDFRPEYFGDGPSLQRMDGPAVGPAVLFWRVVLAWIVVVILSPVLFAIAVVWVFASRAIIK